MSNKVQMNVFLHSLLVIKKMDNFTVSEAKDVLLLEHTEFTDGVEARKFIYRQLCRNITKGLIKRKDKFNGRKKRVVYYKTESFFTSTIDPIKRGSKAKKMMINNTPLKVAKAINYKVELKKELITYELDLNATLEEAKEYTRLSVRFPELKETLQHYHSQAKKNSVKLLGRVHALENLLGYAATDYHNNNA